MRAVVVGSMLASSSLRPLAAQQTDSIPAPRASFLGRVVSSVDSGPVRSADIRLVFVDSVRVIRSRAGDDSLDLFTDSARSRVGITDSLGAFAVRRLAPGQYLLNIRRLGYQPIQGVLNVETTEVYSDFIMQQTSRLLAKVLVTERAGDVVKQKLDRVGFIDRKKFSGSGTFIDRKEILKRKPNYVTDILAQYGVYRGNFVIDRMPVDYEFLRGYPADLVIGVEIFRHGRPTEFNMTRTAPSILSRGGMSASMDPLVLIWTYIP